MPIVNKPLAWIIPLLLLVSCAQESEESLETQHDFRIYEEGGVTIAETIGGPKYSEPLFHIGKAFEISSEYFGPPIVSAIVTPPSS